MAKRPPPVRAVHDCNVFAQALINPAGPAGACVRAAKERRVTVFVSEYVLREVAELPAKLPPRLGVTDARTGRFLRGLTTYAKTVGAVPSVFDFGRDPDDAPYVDLAVATASKFVVSRDNDLMSLSRPGPVGERFRLAFPGVSVLDPAAFLAVLPPDPDDWWNFDFDPAPSG